MGKSTLLLRSLVNAAGTFVYVSGIAWLGFNNPMSRQPSFLMPLFALLLFVISATVTGLLVLGKPIQLYLDGFKKDALTLLFATLAWLVIFLAGVVVMLLLR